MGNQSKELGRESNVISAQLNGGQPHYASLHAKEVCGSPYVASSVGGRYGYGLTRHDHKSINGDNKALSQQLAHTLTELWTD